MGGMGTSRRLEGLGKLESKKGSVQNGELGFNLCGGGKREEGVESSADKLLDSRHHKKRFSRKARRKNSLM